MEKAKVYFTDMRVRPEGQNLQQKLAALIKRAGIDSIDFQDRFAAIKIHFGEAGNLSFLRPNFARTVADEIKKRGGRPFLTDCNTLSHERDCQGLVCRNVFFLSNEGFCRSENARCFAPIRVQK